MHIQLPPKHHLDFLKTFWRKKNIMKSANDKFELVTYKWKTYKQKNDACQTVPGINCLPSNYKTSRKLSAVPRLKLDSVGIVPQLDFLQRSRFSGILAFLRHLSWKNAVSTSQNKNMSSAPFTGMHHRDKSNEQNNLRHKVTLSCAPHWHK